MGAQDRALDQAPADYLRPSSWIIATGIGLGAAFGSLVGPVAKGTVGGAALWLALVQGGAWFGYSLAAVFLVPAFLWLGHRCLDLSDRLRERRAASEVGNDQDEPAGVVSPLVGGGLLTDVERHIMDGLLLTLEHGRAAGGLTHDKIGHAYSNTRHWQFWTDQLAANDLAVKVNGVATALPKSRTYTWTMRQVRMGAFEAPELGTDAPLPPLPAPLEPRAYAKAEVQRV
jgi:hypothetical protein